MPPRKQRELARVLEVLHEEFEDALKEGTADFKKRGCILKIILFGSYAKGGWVDEPLTMKGYQPDFDLLIIVNNSKLCDYADFWHKAADRLIRNPQVETPVSFIVHSRWEVNKYLKEGWYSFSDIRKEGVVLYELDDERSPSPGFSLPRIGCGSRPNILTSDIKQGETIAYSRRAYWLQVWKLTLKLQSARRKGRA